MASYDGGFKLTRVPSANTSNIANQILALRGNQMTEYEMLNVQLRSISNQLQTLIEIQNNNRLQQNIPFNNQLVRQRRKTNYRQKKRRENLIRNRRNISNYSDDSSSDSSSDSEDSSSENEAA